MTRKAKRKTKIYRAEVAGHTALDSLSDKHAEAKLPVKIKVACNTNLSSKPSFFQNSYISKFSLIHKIES